MLEPTVPLRTIDPPLASTVEPVAVVNGVTTMPWVEPLAAVPPTPVIERGQPVYYGAGSQAVADALASYQPTVGLHGHIHESRGATKYGRSPAFNPGSEYGEGVLRGLIVAIRGGEVVGHQFTSG